MQTNIELERGTPCSAGHELKCQDDIILKPNERILVSTGVHITNMEKNYVALIKDKSSIAMKGVYTHAGVIDSDYRGDIKVLLHNHSNVTVKFEKGKSIAQLVILKYEVFDNSTVKHDDSFDHKGFGSTEC